MINSDFSNKKEPLRTQRKTPNLIGEIFDERIIHRNTPIPYPPRFFLWSYLKNSIFQQPIDNLDELLQHIIVEKINEINNFNPVSRNVTNGIG
jgi:hypothetical protein